MKNKLISKEVIKESHLLCLARFGESTELYFDLICSQANQSNNGVCLCLSQWPQCVEVFDLQVSGFFEWPLAWWDWSVIGITGVSTVQIHKDSQPKDTSCRWIVSITSAVQPVRCLLTKECHGFHLAFFVNNKYLLHWFVCHPIDNTCGILLGKMWKND